MSQPLRQKSEALLPSPKQDKSKVLPFKSSYMALAEAQVKRQQVRRLKLRVLEVLAVTTAGAILSLIAGTALARSLTYQMAQQQKLEEITAEVAQLERQVNLLRDRLPERFSTDEIDSAFLRKHGWLRPGQFVIRFLPNNQSLNNSLHP
jgi:hypothetical protein